MQPVAQVLTSGIRSLSGKHAVQGSIWLSTYVSMHLSCCALIWTSPPLAAWAPCCASITKRCAHCQNCESTACCPGRKHYLATWSLTLVRPTTFCMLSAECRLEPQAVITKSSLRKRAFCDNHCRPRAELRRQTAGSMPQALQQVVLDTRPHLVSSASVPRQPQDLAEVPLVWPGAPLPRPALASKQHVDGEAGGMVIEFDD